MNSTLNLWVTISIKGDLPSLTSKEFDYLENYFFPVWACGYNWLQSNEESAKRLVQEINDIVTWYNNSGFFISEGRVILVTHSMGGLVARRATQLVEDKILGIVHGFQIDLTNIAKEKYNITPFECNIVIVRKFHARINSERRPTTHQ